MNIDNMRLVSDKKQREEAIKREEKELFGERKSSAGSLGPGRDFIKMEYIRNQVPITTN